MNRRQMIAALGARLHGRLRRAGSRTEAKSGLHSWPDGQDRYQATEQALHAARMQLQSSGIAEISELDAATEPQRGDAATFIALASTALVFKLRFSYCSAYI